MELELIKLLGHVEQYNRYIPLVSLERLSPEVKLIIESLEEYYNETKDDEIKWKDWLFWYTQLKHPNVSASKVELLEDIVERVEKVPVVTPIVLKNYILRDYSAQIADMAMELTEGTGKYDLDDVDDALLACKREVDKVDGVQANRDVSSSDIKDRLAMLATGKTYNWRLEELRKSIGPIKRGDFIIIGARPDSGKTTFLASEATHFATQLDDGECVLWFNNEEAVERVRSRQVQAALNWTQDEVLKDLDVTYREFEKALNGDLERLVVIDKTYMSVADIDRALQRYNAKIIIIDQIWKVRGFEKTSTSDIDRYAQIATYMRDLAKKHGPVLCTSQIDEKAEGVRYPDMARLYNSKTAVQGEADVILMIGRDHDAPNSIRFLHAPKNKLTLGESKFRNAGWEVTIDQEHARFVSHIPKNGK